MRCREITLLVVIICTFMIQHGDSLECKSCQKNDSSCILGYNSETYECLNDDDVCFSWFDRTELDVIRDASTYKREHIITTSQSAHIRVKGNQSSSTILNFCAHNYLGLSYHPDIVQASKHALDQYDAGLSSVRFICGTQTIHKQLEARIAKFHQREDAILYISRFDANAGIFETLLKETDCVISDELSHASVIDGIRLCKAKCLRYKHKNMQDLEMKLKEVTTADDNETSVKLVVTDGVFSMDGNVAKLPEIHRLAEQNKAIKNSLEAAGGYTTSPKQLIDLLR
ncbi:unnamed protein product [Didymodactylos carnosus]|uniref:Aminotransferase class I/classII large domain-containing protein n=1 Tax=Didymodactylos carnosus TaxID=1234261 RepID=A0A813R0Y0_9BILA|nr:unnamed protein product [Didymodactylos carnosus]CAF3557914.1 unnamed protein product [Didymodactylos carnosus]